MSRKMQDEKVVEFFSKRWVEVDVISVFRRLERIGRIPSNQLRDRDRLLKELNEAQDNAALAETIYLKSCELYDRFKVDYNREMGRLERRAIVRIKAWMDKHKVGSRKQITSDLVVKFICMKKDSRDAYRRLVDEDIEHRRVRDSCKNLSDKWSGRRWLLGSQVKLVEGITEPDFEGMNRKKKRRKS